MNTYPESALSLINQVFALAEKGFCVTFGPIRPESRIIELRVKKETLEVKIMIDFERGILYRDPIEGIERAIKRLAWEIDSELDVMKTKGEK